MWTRTSRSIGLLLLQPISACSRPDDVRIGEPARAGSIATSAMPSAEDVGSPTTAHADAEPCSSEDWARYTGLESYEDIVEGRRFSLRLRRDAAGVWLPAEPLSMPYHHASSLELEPSVDTLLQGRAAREVHLYAVGLGRRSLTHDPGRQTWFATYAARPECVYVPHGSVGPAD